MPYFSLVSQNILRKCGGFAFSEFLDDTDILLRTGAEKFEPQRAYDMVKNTFIDKMPGKKD